MIACSVVTVVAIVFLVMGVFLCKRKRKRNAKKLKREEYEEGHSDLPFWDLSVVLKATDHFSNTNKLGEGGFGPVYKVILSDLFSIYIYFTNKQLLYLKYY